MANDSTVKAGSWGRRSVEKILRIQETAAHLRVPMLYLVDSAGARITDQLDMFPGRRGAGRIFYNQVQMSGQVPQVCLLFGPSAAGGAYIPAFCDVVAMVEGNASMYLGSPRMAEMVIGEKVTLEEMGGARMHCSVSGCGDVLCKTEDEAIAFAKRYLAFMPRHAEVAAPIEAGRPPRKSGKRIEDIVPADENKPFDMMAVIGEIVDEGSWLEIKTLFAREILTGFARIDGRPVGIVANQPKWLGGILFVDSADKAARFIWLCDAFGIPLLYLADVPGFMIGTKVERQGIIRAGAKMIAAVSEASVPEDQRRRAQGVRRGPLRHVRARVRARRLHRARRRRRSPSWGRRPRSTPSTTTGSRRSPKARSATPSSRSCATSTARTSTCTELASEMVIDAVVPGDRLREEIRVRFERFERQRPRPPKKHIVPPV